MSEGIAMQLWRRIVRALRGAGRPAWLDQLEQEGRDLLVSELAHARRWRRKR
jgi:hypothetical protein